MPDPRLVSQNRNDSGSTPAGADLHDRGSSELVHRSPSGNPRVAGRLWKQETSSAKARRMERIAGATLRAARYGASGASRGTDALASQPVRRAHSARSGRRMPASSCGPETIDGPRAARASLRLLESRPLPCPGRRPSGSSVARGWRRGASLPPPGVAALPPPRGEGASFGGSRLRLSRPANRGQLCFQRALNGVTSDARSTAMARWPASGRGKDPPSRKPVEAVGCTFAREMCESAHPTWSRDPLARSGRAQTCRIRFGPLRALGTPALEAAGGSGRKLNRGPEAPGTGGRAHDDRSPLTAGRRRDGSSRRRMQRRVPGRPTAAPGRESGAGGRARRADLGGVGRDAGRVHRRPDPGPGQWAPREPELHGGLAGQERRPPVPGRSAAVSDGRRSNRCEAPARGVAAEPGQGPGECESGAGRAGAGGGPPGRGPGQKGGGHPAPDGARRRPLHAARRAGLGQQAGARQRGAEQPREPRRGRGGPRRRRQRAGQREPGGGGAREGAGGRGDAARQRRGGAGGARRGPAQSRVHEDPGADRWDRRAPGSEHRRLRRPE